MPKAFEDVTIKHHPNLGDTIPVSGVYDADLIYLTVKTKFEVMSASLMVDWEEIKNNQLCDVILNMHDGKNVVFHK